jgi:two-component system, sensor histidine kinase PdtaS
VYEPAENMRVGDGVVVLDSEARIRFASPNATSSFHRLGVQANAEGKRLTELGLQADWLGGVATAKFPLSGELATLPAGRVTGKGLVSPPGITSGGAAAFETASTTTPADQPRVATETNPSTVVATYLLPLNEGSLLLMRDVTDVRRRDRLIRSKDATIREVHHRVKNNLQTISSLLRLQGRRTESAEAREAIEESVRRIRSMALVHETLSQGITTAVPFNDVIRPLVRVVEEGLQESGHGSRPVRFSIEGSAGELPAEIATPLSIVLVELLQNAVEHGYPAEISGSDKGSDKGGSVRVRFDRTAGHEPQLRVVVRDDGCGFPPGFSLSSPSAGASRASLGLTIVRTLITSELGGVISTHNEERTSPSGVAGGGAVVEIRIPLGDS